MEEWKDSDQGIWNFKREAFRGITREADELVAIFTTIGKKSK